MTFNLRVKKSQTIITDLTDKGRIVVNFSGGRDSLSVLLLTKELTEPVAWYMRSGIELPGTIEFVKQICHNLDVELIFSDPKEYQGDLYTLIERWGYFPTLQKPWCNGRLKIRPQRAKMRKLWGNDRVYKLTGIRKSESTRRLYRYSKGYVEPDPEHSGSYMVHPILDWSKKDVAKFLAKKGMADHYGYKVCGVSGCFWCPFYQPSIILRIHQIFPGIYDKIIDLEKKLKKPSLQNHQFLYKVLTQTNLQKWR